MIHEKLRLPTKIADGYVIPLGPVKLVNATTDKGMVGCGAFDLSALETFGIPAAKVKAAHGGLIENIDDLLKGFVKEVNEPGEKAGLKVGMTGLEALELL